jgi:putative ABC transport system ATP-binding protein
VLGARAARFIGETPPTEVPAGLDDDALTEFLSAESADEILKLLQILNREHGKTIVMVTHDAQAAEYAQRILQCDKGTLQVRAAA